MRVLVLLLAAAVAIEIPVRPALETEPVGSDADDPAVWRNPKDIEQSLIIGTNKAAAPAGALVAFGLDGKIRQTVAGLDRPNNVDVEYGLDGRVDIAVVTERLASALRIYELTSARLRQIAKMPVFEGEKDRAAAPMGIALYKRKRDGAVFAIVGRKEGPRAGYLWQYRLHLNGDGSVKADKVREFGNFSGQLEIEAIAVDDELGFVYYADEGFGIHKWLADPDAAGAEKELAVLGREGFRGNREGIAIYAAGRGKGWIVCTDQVPGGSRYFLYPRSGDQSRPHAMLISETDSTDGLEAWAQGTKRFPEGMLIAMNSRGKNFHVFDWARLSLPANARR